MKYPPDFTTGAAVASISTMPEIGRSPAAKVANVQTVLAAMSTVMASEPVARWMSAQGCSPNDGWLLVLPESMAGKLGRLVPAYVRFSSAAPAALLTRDLFGIFR